jgi:hypothetical protein
MQRRPHAATSSSTGAGSAATLWLPLLLCMRRGAPAGEQLLLNGLQQLLQLLRLLLPQDWQLHRAGRRRILVVGRLLSCCRRPRCCCCCLSHLAAGGRSSKRWVVQRASKAEPPLPRHLLLAVCIRPHSRQQARLLLLTIVRPLAHPKETR